MPTEKTLRDEFAMAILIAMTNRTGSIMGWLYKSPKNPRQAAEWSYSQADAMLEARKSPKEEK